jgi:hypothetical protein
MLRLSFLLMEQTFKLNDIELQTKGIDKEKHKHL